MGAPGDDKMKDTLDWSPGKVEEGWTGAAETTCGGAVHVAWCGAVFQLGAPQSL